MKFHNINTKTIQLVIACILCFAGLTLLYLGFFFPPTAIIHNSILVAFGEISTLSGALFGIDYKYRFNTAKQDKDNNNNK